MPTFQNKNETEIFPDMKNKKEFVFKFISQ